MRLAFVGLGEQGLPLALNLVETRRAVAGYDLSAAALERFRAAGGDAASSISEAVAGAEIVFVCVRDDVQMSAVMAQLSDAIGAGAVLVIHSTITPKLVAQCGRMARSAGADAIDAPVSGGAAGAEQKRAVFMVGGGADAVARCAPLLACSGEAIHVGELGAGSRCKLIHQLVLIGNIHASAQGYALARASGLDINMVAQALNAGAAQSRAGARLFEQGFTPHMLDALQKDWLLCGAFAADHDVAAGVGIDASFTSQLARYMQ